MSTNTPTSWLARWREPATYAAAVVVTCVLVAWFLELPWRDLRVPFQYASGDVPSGHMWVKALLDNPWLLHNDYLGAPDGQDFHDFPTSDGLHFVLLKLLGLVFGDVFTTVNVYFLLGFPLTALTSLFVLRRLGVSRGPAVLASVLFTLLPYHFLRGLDHFFLAQYWMLPLLLWLALRVYLDKAPFWSWDEARGRVVRNLLNWSSLGAVAICLAASSTGVYYAFFGCFLLLVAGCAAAVVRRRWYPLFPAALMVAIVCAGVAVNVSPWVVYRLQHGPNPEAVRRSPLNAERAGLKITALLMPTLEHRLKPLRNFRAAYERGLEGNNLPTNAVRSSLGFLASLGFLFLLARAVLFRGGTKPTLAGGLTALTLAALLLSTMGGFGTYLAYLGVTWIRGYERISVVIAFLALAALALLIDRGCQKWAVTPWRRWAVRGLLAGLLVLGFLDQTSPAWFARRGDIQGVFEIDRQFVQSIESSVPPGSMIFQMPHMIYPESPRQNKLHSYDLSRGYLHSRTLRWSFGAMKGRPTALRLDSLAALPTPKLVEELRSAGFEGIYVDRHGYADYGKALEADLKRLLGKPSVVSSHNRLVYYGLNRVRNPRAAATSEPRTEPAQRAQ